MRIRTILILAFLTATLVPTAIFGGWSYQQGIKREFADVEDRHLLLAQNVGRALERYHTDLVGTFDSISTSLLENKVTPNLHALMSSINMLCVLIVDSDSGTLVARADMETAIPANEISEKIVNAAKAIAQPGKTTFSHVMPSKNNGNIMLGVRQYGDQIAITIVSTQYFVDLGKSISFGKKGHAAIVDNGGNVLAHPLPSWVESRKNISKVSAVQRMMNGETGIEQFYSPALKGDMIAGLTSVPGPGWGVMIPQPIAELYDKVYENNKSILVTLVIGLIITIGFVIVLADSLASPLERLLQVMKTNAKEERLNNSVGGQGLLPLTEIAEFNQNYNDMVDRVSEANDKIHAMAYSDGITGLPNRAKLYELANDVLENCQTRADGGIFVFVDLDDFKQINDVHGHTVGDDFLRDCAAKIKSVVARHSQEDREATIARFGGDEFAILLPGLVTKKEIQRFLSQLQKELSKSSEALDFITRRSASIGCSRYPLDGNVLEDLIKFADIAMYHAKKSGKNQSQIYSPEIGRMTAAELRIEVEKAILNDQLVLEYQPKIRAHDQRVTSVEALVRWQHPTVGRIPPNEWVPAISNSPVIKQLGEWVIARAMDDHKIWTQAGLKMGVAVNVGSEHFSSAKFIDFLTGIAKTKNFDAANMEIEITEDALFTSEANAEEMISQLHENGYKIAIDDFGTGYSNIARLSKLPVDSLKIDRSVISQAAQNGRVASMLECIVLMAKKLGCETVAEGVETLRDVKRASASGITILQGFHYSASLPVAKLISWVRAHEQANVIENSAKKDTKNAA